MKLPRRNLLHLAVGAATLPVVSRIAKAQTYPARPVRIIVGFPPGFAPDMVARMIAQSLSDSLRQQFVVENRPGAGSNIAADAVVRAPPDGYSLLLVTQTNATNAALYGRISPPVRARARHGVLDFEQKCLRTCPVAALGWPRVSQYVRIARGAAGNVSAADQIADFIANFRLLLGRSGTARGRAPRHSPSANVGGARPWRRFRPTCAPSVLPESIEAVGAQLCISHRVHDVAMAQEVLQRAGIDAVSLSVLVG